MTELDEQLEGEFFEPEDVFQAVGNRLRIEILRRLAEASEPVPFTTLQEELGLDDSGKFNYHLGKLTGHFIRKSSRGYELRHAGWAVIKAIRSGSMTHDPHIESLTIDLDCPFCGGDQQLSYKNETLDLRCQDCDGVVTDDQFEPGTLMSYDFPVSGLRNREYQEIAYAAHRLYDAEIVALIGGVCPVCAGTVMNDLELCPEHVFNSTTVCDICNTKYAAWCEFTCQICEHQRRFPPWFQGMLHPAVISFFYEVAGITKPVPFQKLMSSESPDFHVVTESVRMPDPIELSYTFHCQGEECTVNIDESLEVSVEEISI